MGSKRDRVQFLVLHLIYAVLCETMLIMHFFSVDIKYIKGAIIAFIAIVFVGAILKKLGYWYKNKTGFKRLFSGFVILLCWAVLNLSEKHSVFILLSILFPPVVLGYITYKDYKYNFEK